MDVEGVKVGIDNAVREGEMEIAVCQNEVIGVVLAETIDVLLVVVVVIDEESELELSVVTIGVDGVGVVMFEKREVEGDEFTEVIEIVASVSLELLVRLYPIEDDIIAVVAGLGIAVMDVVVLDRVVLILEASVLAAVIAVSAKMDEGHIITSEHTDTRYCNSRRGL